MSRGKQQRSSSVLPLDIYPQLRPDSAHAGIVQIFASDGAFVTAWGVSGGAPGQRDDNGTPQDASDDVVVIGDYRLLPGSPGIDRGTNDVDNPDTDEIETLPQHDPTGLPRIMDGDANGLAVVDIGAYEYLRGDVNNDGHVNILDAILVRNSFGKSWTSDPAARRADVTTDGIVNILDIIAVRNQLGAP
ncbi:MAG: hypothetical protein HQ592_07075 [Planctomycetes bacterium]|nr:hypothetical protein [Planctomycetota bacterium]